MRRTRRQAIIAAALWAVPSVTLAGTLNTYTGPNNGLWSVPANWSAGVVPTTTAYDVIIPSNLTVQYDLTSPSTIGAFNSSGNTKVLVGTSLTATGQLIGLVTDQGGAFASTSSQAGAIDNVRILTSNGGNSLANAASYNLTLGNTYADYLAADGAGSALNLSSVNSINTLPGSGNNSVNVHASNNGTINLSNLLSVTNTAGRSDARVAFVAESGGSINLTKLASANTAVFQISGGTMSLPALATAVYGTFNVGAGAAISAPALTNMNYGSVNLSTGSAFNAPALTTAINSTLTYQPNQTLTTGLLSNIDNTRLLVSGGVAVASVTAASYNLTLGNTYADYLAADGAGSALNLSSVNSINTLPGSGNNSVNVHASNNGTINLSNLLSVTNTAGRSDARVAFVAESGGSINLTKLASANTAVFQISGGTMSLPALATAVYGTFNVGAGAAISAPALTNMNYGSVNLSTGSAFNAPALTTAINSTLTYQPNQTLTTGLLSNIDNTRLLVSGGVAVASVTAASYNLTLGNTYADYLAADGAGSALNLSSVNSINTLPGSGNNSVNVHASNNGTINLSNLLSVTNTAGRSDARVAFVAESGGSINLTKLASANTAVFQISGGTMSLPALATAVYGTFNVGAGAAISAPALTNMNYGSVNLSTGSAFNAPALTTAINSTLTYQPNQTLTTGLLSNVDNTRLLVSGGVAVASVTAASYNLTLGNTYADYLAADGAGSALNLSSVNSINTLPGSGNNSVNVHASNNGTINLSNLLSVTNTAGRSDARVAFVAESGGSINLTKLASANTAVFQISGGTMSLPALATAVYGTFNVGAGAAISAPALTNMNYGSVNLSTGSAFNAPALTTAINSTLTYQPNQTLTTGLLSNVDNTRLLVSGGVAVASVTAASYNLTLGNTYADYLAADGAGSALNLSSVNSINTLPGSGNNSVNVHASNNGTINLSNLLSVTNTSGQNNVFVSFVAESGGTINAGRLLQTDTVRFNASSNGTIVLGDITKTNNTTFQTSSASGVLQFTGGLVLNPTSSLVLAPLSTVSIPGRIAFQTSSVSQFQASTAIVKVIGSDVQNVEVGGFDNGAAVYGSAGNFGFGQFQVGSSNQSSVVQLVDVYDNGNRGTTGKEAMYAYGLGGGPAGLVMASGSLLAIGGFDVYVNQNGTLVNLQSLIPSGSNLVPYTFGGSNGFILKALALSPNFYNSSSTGDRDNWTAGNGSWDNSGNWSLGITPSSNLQAFITPSGTVTVAGPASGATVKTLVVDNSGSGTTVLNLNSSSATTTVLGGLEVGTAGIVNLTAGTLNVGSTLNIGTVQTQPGTTYITGTILNQGGMTLRGTTTVGAVVNNVSMELAAGSHTFGPVVGPGSFQVDAGAIGSAERIRQAGVTVNGTLQVRRQAGSDVEVSRTTTLSMGSSGKFDLVDNPLILDSGSVYDVRTLVKSAYANGAWNGPGIGSSAAGLSTRTAVGYTTAALAGVSTWNGESVTSADILVRRTLLGDANLDGQVNFTDLSVVLANYGAANPIWGTGDFTYDGVVNFSDLSAVLSGYGGALGATPASLVAGPAAEPAFDWQPILDDSVAAGDLAQLESILASNGVTPAYQPATVPEPASTLLLTVVAVGGLTRRRRPR